MKNLIIIFLSLNPFIILCQSKVEVIKIPKNEFKIYYHTTFSKMNFDLSIVSGLGFVDFWVNSHQPNNFFRGKTFGFEYGRSISPKNKIFFAARHTEKGQQSPNYFNTIGSPNEEDYPLGYGGTSYEVALTTNEFLLGWERLFMKKRLLSFSYSLGISADFYNSMIIRDFIIERETGIKRGGCCYNYFYGHNVNYFDRVKNNLSRGHFRLGLFVGGNTYYQIVKNLYLNIRLETVFLTKLIHRTKKLSAVHEANGFAFSFGGGIAYRF